MLDTNWIDENNLIIEKWETPIFFNQKIEVDILRLDLLHPIVSGNKWLKLKGFLKEMENEKCHGILTQGGHWSNHIVAVAAACNYLGIESAAFLKGTEKMTPSLEEAESYGMELLWVERDAYDDPNCYMKMAGEMGYTFVPMGGMGKPGRDGFYELIKKKELQKYSHFVSAVGSGTMFSGILLGKNKKQKATGISALRLRPRTIKTLESLSSKALVAEAFITDRFIGKGYAKVNDAQINWMNHFFMKTGIATDIVYTCKTFMAVETLAAENYFSEGEKILLIHSGGLQGNRSLPAQTLVF